MVEPTETEPVEEMDRFVEAVKAILAEAEKDPDFVKRAPHEAFRCRLDEVAAARNPVLTYRPEGG
jgi:glycine dehydrogenase subunit 2